MAEPMEICEVGWELYDKWEKLADKKETSKEKNKDLDRKVVAAWKEFRAHVESCSNCHDPFYEI